MSWVIEHSKHKGNAFVVLLMIANHAKEDGSGAWPSVPTIAAKSRISERTVQRTLGRLARSKELLIETGQGPHGSNLYTVKMTGVKVTGDILTPVPSNDTRVVTNRAQGGDIAVSPKPSLKQPSINHHNHIDVPNWIPLLPWQGFVQMRKQMPRVPFTDRAQRLAISDLEKLRNEGNDPAAVLDQSTKNGWRGLFAIKNGNGDSNGDNYKTAGRRRIEQNETAAQRALSKADSPENLFSSVWRGPDGGSV
jgi:Helix-turn-helix domain